MTISFDTAIWDRPDFLALPEKKKLAVLFLRTNRLVGVSGIYPVSIAEIARGITSRPGHVAAILPDLPGIEYDLERQVVYLRDRYALARSENPAAQRLAADENRRVKTYLWQIFLEDYPDTRSFIDRCPDIPRPVKAQAPPSAAGADSSVLERRQYANLVVLTVGFHGELERRHGTAVRDRIVQKLSSWKRRKGKSGGRDEEAVNRWVIDAVREEIAEEERNGGPKRQYARCVWLRPAEFQDLGARYGTRRLESLIRTHDVWKYQHDWDVGDDYGHLQRLAGGRGVRTAPEEGDAKTKEGTGGT
jgi:hypothetical protein